MDTSKLIGLAVIALVVIFAVGALSCFFEIDLLSRGSCMFVGILIGDYLP